MVVDCQPTHLISQCSLGRYRRDHRFQYAGMGSTLHNRMQTCIRVLIASRSRKRFCTGNHMCRFLAWNTKLFQTMPGAEKFHVCLGYLAALLSQMFPSPIGVLPQLMPQWSSATVDGNHSEKWHYQSGDANRYTYLECYR